MKKLLLMTIGVLGLCNADEQKIISYSPFGDTVDNGSCLEGTFYDLKLKRNGKASGLKAENQKSVIEALAKFFKNWDRNELKGYYRSSTKRYASSWYLPAAYANYGPIAFGVGDKDNPEYTWECQPSAWLVVYRGYVVAPKTGTFRFIGTGDDFLAVRFKKKIVLDAGYRLPSYYNKKSPDDCFTYHGDASVRQSRLEKFLKARHGYEMIKGVPGCSIWDSELGGLVAGAPFKVKEGNIYPIEIAVSEFPGGKLGFVLFIEDITHGVKNNAKRYDIFRTCDTNPDPAKVMKALRDAGCYSGEYKIPFNEESPIWRVPSKEEIDDAKKKKSKKD